MAVKWAVGAVLAAGLVSLAACGQPEKCSGPSPVPVTESDPSYLPAELRACAFDVSCAATTTSASRWTYLQMQGSAPASCLGDWNPPLSDETACALKSNNCDEFLACASHDHCPSWCAPHVGGEGATAWVCDGSQLIVCDGSGMTYGTPWEDCAAHQMTCKEAQGSAACTSGATCAQATNGSACDGTRIVGCDQSTLLAQSEDCAAYGATCATFILPIFGPIPFCLSPGETTCDPSTYTPTCMNNVATGCINLGLVESVNCAEPDLDAFCVATGGGAQCEPNAHECDSLTADTCQGHNFVTCGTDQKLATVDCTSLGFRTCGVADGRARCLP